MAKKNCLDGIPHVSGKNSIVKSVAKDAKVTQADAKAVVDNYWKTIVKKLKKSPKDKVTIPYIGTISVKEVKGRTYKLKGLDNTKKKSVTTKDHKAIKFTCSKKAIAFLGGDSTALDRPEPKKTSKGKGKTKSTAKAKTTKKASTGSKSTSKSKGKGKNKK